MSMGYGGFAYKIAEDADAVLYEYGGYNWSFPEYSNSERLRDGSFTISKDCFIEPEIHQKLKRMPSGRKRLVTKRIPRDVDIDEAISKGKIRIENCSNAWYTFPSADSSEVDMTAVRLIGIILLQYQETGTIPEKTFFDC